jgi:hypothetical protein
MFTRALKILACTLIMGLSAPLYADNDDLLELEIADLAFMREEEKMARDVYAELYQYYKERGIELIILANITVSEQKHMDAMLSLLEKYQLEDPAAGLERGEFENTVLAAVYANLVSDSEANQTILDEPVAGGKVSREAALYVGAWIEERDMIDILHAIGNTSRAEIVGVYTSLLCGSREHLRAFVKRLGADNYQPQLLHSSTATTGEINPVETLEYWLGDESDAICI